MADGPVRVVLLTGPDEPTLASMAARLVDEGLAACVNVIPRVRSVYRWEGEVHDETESLAIVKTTDTALRTLEDRVHALHPYDLPEFLVLPVDGSHDYLEWVSASVTGGRKGTP